MKTPRSLLLLALFSAPLAAAESPRATALEARIQASWAQSPELGQAIGNLVHTRDRAGNLRLIGDALQHPEAPVFLAEQLLSAESQDLRWATSASLAASPHVTLDIVDPLMEMETDPRARSLLLTATRYWEENEALGFLRTALSDTDAQVRAEATRLVSHHQSGDRLATQLQAGLRDEEAEVRGLSARALGWLHVTGAFAHIRPLLGEDDADVRLLAFQACKRLDSSRTAALPEMTALAKDPDPHLRRLAERLQNH